MIWQFNKPGQDFDIRDEIRAAVDHYQDKYNQAADLIRIPPQHMDPDLADEYEGICDITAPDNILPRNIWITASNGSQDPTNTSKHINQQGDQQLSLL
jgi:hypothetical protein